MEEEQDHYAVLGLDVNASEAAIKKAYRKSSLLWHPDRRRGDDTAAKEIAKEKFRTIKDAYNILSDSQKKLEFDKKVKAKQARLLRDAQRNASQRALVNDLEERERRAEQRKRDVHMNPTETIEQKTKRVRAENERWMQNASSSVTTTAATATTTHTATTSISKDSKKGANSMKLKIKWKLKKNNVQCCSYSRDDLLALLCEYGDIFAIVVSKSSAIVEFKSSASVENSIKTLTKTGLQGHPSLRFSLIVNYNEDASVDHKPEQQLEQQQQQQYTFQHFESFSSCSGNVNSSKHRDYENITMMNMRRAQERRRIIESMRDNDGNDDDDDDDDDDAKDIL